MDCATSQAPWLPYKQRSLCDGVMLQTFVLSLVESKSAHDEASVFGHHCMGVYLVIVSQRLVSMVYRL